MRVLVTYGSKRGGTEGIARMVAEGLRDEGVQVDLLRTKAICDLGEYDAVIVGGALYANRWHRHARRFVKHHENDLRKVPVWLFSSGPLDDSADRQTIKPTKQVQALMERVGAQSHVTFGGRLPPDARGFPASAMAKKRSGDWRNPGRVRTWGSEIAKALPTARPIGAAATAPTPSASRLLVHAFIGWAFCAATMGLLLATGSLARALIIHAVAAPLIFVGISTSYFRSERALPPAAAALACTAVVALLDLVLVAGIVQHSLAMFGSVPGTWLPFALIFVATWATGELVVHARPHRASPHGPHPLSDEHAPAGPHVRGLQPLRTRVAHCPRPCGVSR